MISLNSETEIVEVFDREFESKISGPINQTHYEHCKKFYDLTYEFLEFNHVWCGGLCRVDIRYQSYNFVVDCYSDSIRINQSISKIQYSEDFIDKLISELDRIIQQ